MDSKSTNLSQLKRAQQTNMEQKAAEDDLHRHPLSPGIEKPGTHHGF